MVQARSPSALGATSPSFHIQFSKSGFGNRPVVSRRDCARGVLFKSLEEGAGNAGCALHPRPRVRKKSTRVSNQGHTATAGIPCANGFNGFLRALLGDHAWLPPSFAEDSANLAPASERQDHTTSPSAAAGVRLIALPRPPHPALNVRDDRDTPLVRRRDVRMKPPIAAMEKRIILRCPTGRPKSA